MRDTAAEYLKAGLITAEEHAAILEARAAIAAWKALQLSRGLGELVPAPTSAQIALANACDMPMRYGTLRIHRYDGTQHRFAMRHVWRADPPAIAAPLSIMSFVSALLAAEIDDSAAAALIGGSFVQVEVDDCVGPRPGPPSSRWLTWVAASPGWNCLAGLRRKMRSILGDGALRTTTSANIAHSSSSLLLESEDSATAQGGHQPWLQSPTL